MREDRAREDRAQLARPRIAWLPTAWLALSLGVLLSAAASASLPWLRHPAHSPGEQVTVQGVVSDAKGNPLAGLHVTLEASRATFALYPWGLQKRYVVTGTAESSPKGEFGLEFPWNPWYNRFELTVTIPVGVPGGEDVHVLWHGDISRQVPQGSPVVVPVTLDEGNSAFLEAFRTFVASLDTDEERRSYRESGRPDQVDHNKFPDHLESAWWYFRAGKVLRFRDGHLEKVETFAPVEPLK